MRTTPALLAAALLASACAPADEPPETTADTTATPSTAAAAFPDTTAASLWTYLQQADYRSWRMWPGKEAFYAGGEPHGMLLTTYVSPDAADALSTSTATQPVGAIFVKENYAADSTLVAVTVMHKVPGFDPAHGDWFWAKYDASGVAEASGRVEMCQQCHVARADADYLMTARPGG